MSYQLINGNLMKSQKRDKTVIVLIVLIILLIDKPCLLFGHYIYLMYCFIQIKINVKYQKYVET